MKIRNGFVSNSSSSSFVIVGNKWKFSDLHEFLKLYNITTELDSKKYECDIEYAYDVLYELREYDETFKLDIKINSEEATFYIGIGNSWADDECEFDMKFDVELLKALKGDKPIRMFGETICC